MNRSKNPSQDQLSQAQAISILVNDQPVFIPPNTTLEKLLEVLDIKTPAIAVELNREIQPRDTFASTILKMDDHLEVVTLVGGG